MSKSILALKPTNDDPPINKLPLEIIAKIVRQLSLSDVIVLLSVSKIWRSTFLNQNIIWQDICRKLSVRDTDYAKCLSDSASHYLKFNEYFEANSLEYFGPICYWWKIYNQYNMVLKNIKDNNCPAIRIPRQKQSDISYCTDNYIINIYMFDEQNTTIQVYFLGSRRKLVGKKYLLPIDNFYELLKYEMLNRLQIIGNNDFLVLEIHSVIFVYKIINNEFVNGYSKVIQRSGDQEVDFSNIYSFLDVHCNTVMDLSGDKLALIHPEYNVIFLIDLNSGQICKELIYSSKKCVVDTMKCADKRLMIGISYKNPDNNRYTNHCAIVYHLEENEDENKLKITLFGAVTQFKVTDSHIGIENRASATPILTKMTHTHIIRIIWIDCDTFSFDCTRKFLYYSVNSSIFQYDLCKSRSDKYEVTQKIAVETISDNFSLTPINDRFLFVQSATPNSYDIFDVKFHNTVKSIPVHDGLNLAHVGKLCVMFASADEFKIYAFS